MTEIRLYNTMTRAKVPFVPLDAQNVRMYVCGPTVYDRAHLGNARPVVVFDVLYRLLRHVYGPEHVNYVRNFTDVDDKIIARAEQDGREIGDITSETTQWFLDDMRALGALDPNEMPRATQYIAEMVAMIGVLIEEGHAYEAQGHVLFAVESYADYGQLSGRSIKDMIAGARVEVAPYKRNPMDFVLWKPSTPDQPGWDSPWGRGRPGWHIECSAMSYELLGPRFDIHGGGNDLIFPHHENEIAQSCCVHPAPAGEACFAQIWMHNEMLQVEGRKMSKSLGNFFTVHDLLEQGVPGEVIRFVFLGTHYRKPMDWTERKRQEAENKLREYHELIAKYSAPERAGELEPSNALIEALANDLNTHGALTVVTATAKEARFRQNSDWRPATQLRVDLAFLGLLDEGEANQSWHYWVQSSDVDLRRLGHKLFDLRAAALRTKDFAPVDAMKAALLVAGVEVRMSKEGVELVPGAGFDPDKLEGLL